MARTHIVVDTATGSSVEVPYTPAEEAEADIQHASWEASQVPVLAEQQRRSGLAGDTDYLALLDKARTASNAQINTWLTNNVTTLAQARTVLGALIKIVALKL